MHTGYSLIQYKTLKLWNNFVKIWDHSFLLSYPRRSRYGADIGWFQMTAPTFHFKGRFTTCQQNTWNWTELFHRKSLYNIILIVNLSILIFIQKSYFPTVICEWTFIGAWWLSPTDMIKICPRTKSTKQTWNKTTVTIKFPALSKGPN